MAAGAPVFREEQIPDLPLPEFAPLDHLAELAANIGTVHTASQRIVDQRKLTPVPLSVLHRSTALAGQDERRQLSGKDRTYPPIRIWQRASERIIPAAADAIGLLQAGEGKRFVATHGNLWPEHRCSPGQKRTRVSPGSPAGRGCRRRRRWLIWRRSWRGIGAGRRMRRKWCLSRINRSRRCCRKSAERFR